MNILLVVFGVAIVGILEGTSTPDSHWDDFKSRFGKVYSNQDEEITHYEQWQVNRRIIQEHNMDASTGQHSYTLEENVLSDLSAEQLTSINGARPEFGNQTQARYLTLQELDDMSRQVIPRQVDYRKSPCMNPIRNQGQCGCCWAFAATNPVEFQLCQKFGFQVALSEQQLLDCSNNYGNNGCSGGWYYNAWQYVADAPGQSYQYYYPFSGAQYSCRYDINTAPGSVQSWATVPAKDEIALKNVVATIGPVSVAIDASLPTFAFYSGGVYHDRRCSNVLDHAVVVVGYGTLDNVDYWIVRNSWGAQWGLSGYILMQRGINLCGIAEVAAYPIVL